MIVDILKGLVIGICASAPIGPIAVLVVQTTLNKGHKAGFITGMGACIVDTLFSIIAIFALAAAEKLINDHRELILILGGLIVTALGLRMCLVNPLKRLRQKKVSSVSVTDFMKALVMGLSNPGAILVIFALFAFFGIGPADGEDWKMAPIIISVFAGATAYWFSVTALLNHFRKKFKLRTIIKINRMTGVVVALLGLILLGQGLFRVLFLGYPLI